MKSKSLIIAILAIVAALSGWLMSKASWIGRVGMTFFYKEYNFLKIWWQGAIAVFLVFIFLFLLHSILQQRLSGTVAKVLHLLLLLLAVAGMYYTQADFTNNLSHRLLGWHFHYGVYLFWMGWMLICLYFIFKPKKKITIVTNSDKTETVNQ